MTLKFTLPILASVIITACQGMPSEKPPIHVNPNMDFQEKFKAQAENSFFDDNSATREPVEGTVPRGFLMQNTELYEGIRSNGAYVTTNPVELSRSFLYRGKERYEIYCTPCHGSTGAGDGIIIGYGYVPPPSIYADKIIDMPDGELYSAIYNGVRSMPSYRHQIPVNDRWAIVAYIRALQRSQNATVDDLKKIGITPDQISSLQQMGNNAAAN